MPKTRLTPLGDFGTAPTQLPASHRYLPLDGSLSSTVVVKGRLGHKGRNVY